MTTEAVLWTLFAGAVIGVVGSIIVGYVGHAIEEDRKERSEASIKAMDASYEAARALREATNLREDFVKLDKALKAILDAEIKKMQEVLDLCRANLRSELESIKQAQRKDQSDILALSRGLAENAMLIEALQQDADGETA